MIGYVQDGTVSQWNDSGSKWIEEVAQSGQEGWSVDDVLELIHDDVTAKVDHFRSMHRREKDLDPIELRHLWIALN